MKYDHEVTRRTSSSSSVSQQSEQKRDERDSFGYFVAQIMEKKTYDKTKKERVT